MTAQHGRTGGVARILDLGEDAASAQEEEESSASGAGAKWLKKGGKKVTDEQVKDILAKVDKNNDDTRF